MFKKITGVADTKEEVRQQCVASRTQFNDYRTHLQNKKLEYFEIRDGYVREREEIKKEQRQAE